VRIHRGRALRGQPAIDARTGAQATARGSRRRAGARWRARERSAAAIGALGSGVLAIARLITSVAVLVAVLIGLAIVLRDIGANPANGIVKGIHEGANFFAGAFTGLISFHGHAKRAITVDWGIAVIVYLIAGTVIAGYTRRIGARGLRFGGSHRAALR
jgi:hypothetical protein